MSDPVPYTPFPGSVLECLEAMRLRRNELDAMNAQAIEAAGDVMTHEATAKIKIAALSAENERLKARIAELELELAKECTR